MWDVLKEYPAARVRLEAIATKRLEKYRTDPDPLDVQGKLFTHYPIQKYVVADFQAKVIQLSENSAFLK